jgi:hypothetical protein
VGAGGRAGPPLEPGNTAALRHSRLGGLGLRFSRLSSRAARTRHKADGPRQTRRASQPGEFGASGAQPKKIKKKNPGLTGSAPLGMTVWFNMMLEVGLVGQQGGCGSRRQVCECGVFTAVDPVFGAGMGSIQGFLQCVVQEFGRLGGRVGLNA